MKQIDERDTMFARMALVPGTAEYEDYYGRHPERLAVDEVIRSKPDIGGPGTGTYSVVNSPIADANFLFLSQIRHLAEGPVAEERVEVDKEEMTRKLKGLALHYGAVLAGVCRLEDYHYYSHRGRHREVYGEEVDGGKHGWALVFAVEMDKEMLDRAPMLPEVVETSRAYVEAAVIGMQIAYYLRLLGYDARNHMDGNYLLVAPLVARDAGLGELGRNSILTTREYGSRVRLGVVTTELELVADKPKEFGLQRFCELCGLCAKTCPAGAIPRGARKEFDGLLRWQTVQEDCYTTWRHLGTDCGICISSCPFSQGLGTEPIDTDQQIRAILARHKEKFPVRPFIKDPPSWLK